jgi:putative ABC transport system ATP-binding protein
MPDAKRALVRCVDVGRTYGSGQGAVVAVYDVTCGVRPGDRIAIVGPSGSGKSTLLHLLAGLEVPTVGSVAWPGFGDQPRGPENIGLVFQMPSLIPSMTVVENVELPLLFADVEPREARSRAEEALAVLELSDLGDDLPQELSGGQAQRAVIARVLAARPRLILADEPTSQLDRANAAHVADVLVEVADELGAALVIATHDALVSSRLTDEWPIQDGRLSHLGAAGLPLSRANQPGGTRP